MKTLIFSMMALMITAQAHATCADRASGGLQPRPQFTSALPGNSASVQAVQIQPRGMAPAKASNGKK